MSRRKAIDDWLDTDSIIEYHGHCALFHKWHTMNDTGVHQYQRCQRCGARRILKQVGAAHQPIHSWWRNVPIKYV